MASSGWSKARLVLDRTDDGGSFEGFVRVRGGVDGGSGVPC